MNNTSFPALQNNPSTPPVSKTRMITLIGVFAAISTILMFIEMPLPLMPPFLKIDLSGVPILIIGFMYGPMPAIYVTIIKDLVHMLSSHTLGMRPRGSLLFFSANWRTFWCCPALQSFPLWSSAKILLRRALHCRWQPEQRPSPWSVPWQTNLC